MAAAEAGEATPQGAWSDRAILTVLVAVAAALHGGMVAYAEVAARDSIGFIRYALRLGEEPWGDVLPGIEQHPGYPVAIHAVSLPLRCFWGMTPAVMALSAQLASALAAVVLVIPLYYLAREFFDRRSAVTTVLLFQCLPVCLQVTSDGLSEGLYLLFMVSALVLAVQGLRGRSPVRFGLSGLFTGLAYLTRPEGVSVALAVATVLGCGQAMPVARWPWRQALACALCFTLMVSATGGPYVAAIGGITPKPTALRMMQTIGQLGSTPRAAPAIESRLPVASLVGVWWKNQYKYQRVPSIWWAAWALGSEVVRSLQYAAAFPALLGAWLFRSRLRQSGTWLVLAVFGLQAALLCWMSVAVGYVSERHTLLLVLIALLPAGAALVACGDWLAGQLRRGAPVGLVGLLTGLAASAAFVPSAVRPLHANRAGHRAAGEWLAEHAGPADVILDPFCWAHFYAGHVFREGSVPPAAGPRVGYVILENSENPHGRLSSLQMARDLAGQGTLVYQWTPSHTLRKRKAEIVEVYAVRLKP